MHFVFSSQDSAPKGSVKLPEVARLSDLFAPHSPYAQVTALVHPVTGQEVRAAKLQKSVRVAGMELLEAGSVVVAYPDGRLDFHPAGLVPPVLLAKLVPQDKVLQPAAESHPAVKTYDDQNQLARDLYHSGRPGKHYKSIGLGEVIAYEVPAGTYYRADGPMLTSEQEYYTSPKRLFGYEGMVLSYQPIDTSEWEEYLWNFYTPSEYLTKSFYAQLTSAQYDIYYQKLSELRNALAVDIPKFIKGERSLSDWDSWYESLKRTCQVDQITTMLNNVYQELHAES